MEKAASFKNTFCKILTDYFLAERRASANCTFAIGEFSCSADIPIAIGPDPSQNQNSSVFANLISTSILQYGDK